MKSKFVLACWLLLTFSNQQAASQNAEKPFKVIAFYTAKEDLAHISFVHNANNWFPAMAKKYNFIYDSTNDWSQLNKDFLQQYQVVIFLDTRPDGPLQRKAFENYMKGGGAWMGFHFAAFALTPSAFPQNWNWYHNEFLGSGAYKSNTWHPTPAILRVEDSTHPVTKGLPHTFQSAPNEWYRWENDLTKNPAIKILLAIDPSSFPLGNGPKQSEIWHSGYYPVVWTNIHYKMVYINMGHNDMDYDGGTNAALSNSFDNATQNRLIINALLWLGGRKK
jgi:hypothetical protein